MNNKFAETCFIPTPNVIDEWEFFHTAHEKVITKIKELENAGFFVTKIYPIVESDYNSSWLEGFQIIAERDFTAEELEKQRLDELEEKRKVKEIKKLKKSQKEKEERELLEKLLKKYGTK